MSNKKLNGLIKIKIQKERGKCELIKIDDENEVEELLENVKYFFENIDEVENRLRGELNQKELERDDLLHEVELAKLNAIDVSRTFKRLRRTLQERRIIKDKIDLISTMKGYSKKFIEKGIIAETDTTLTNIKKLLINKENRKYTPRVLKDLKCASGNEVRDDAISQKMEL